MNALHYAFRVGLRYLRPKHRHFLLSLITVIATVGVMVAVAAPEVTLSVMNGFETEVRQRIVSTNYNVFVLSRGDFSGYKELQRQLEARPGITAVSPFVRREAMISFSGGGSLSQRFRPCVVHGVDPDQEAKTTRVIQAVQPKFLGFNTDAFDAVDHRHYPGIVLGVELGRELLVSLGDVVTLAAPLGDQQLGNLDDLGEVELGQRSFRVVGFMNSGFYEFDVQLAFIDLGEAQDFLAYGERVYGLGVRVDDSYAADQIGAELDATLGMDYYTNNWIFMFRNVFTWLETERKLMALVFLLIIAVAVITVVGMLVMIVMEKRKAIGILKSLGAPRRGIMAIFVIHGTVIGAVGAILGSGLGVLICRLVDRIGINLPGDVYIIDTLPVQMQPLDFVLVSVSALVLCFVATLYPSWEASRLDPVEAIRYE